MFDTLPSCAVVESALTNIVVSGLVIAYAVRDVCFPEFLPGSGAPHQSHLPRGPMSKALVRAAVAPLLSSSWC